MSRLIFMAFSVLCITASIWAKGPWGYIVCDDNSTAMQYAVKFVLRSIRAVPRGTDASWTIPSGQRIFESF